MRNLGMKQVGGEERVGRLVLRDVEGPGEASLEVTFELSWVEGGKVVGRERESVVVPGVDLAAWPEWIGVRDKLVAFAQSHRGRGRGGVVPVRG